MARLSIDITTNAGEVAKLFHEVSGLLETRAVPDDLGEEIEAIAEAGIRSAVNFSEGTTDDGKLMVQIEPTPQLLGVLERLRQCEAA